MKLRNTGNSSDPLPTELSDLLSFCGKDVHEAVHIAYAESLDSVLRALLPLRPEAGTELVSCLPAAGHGMGSKCRTNVEK